MRRWLAMSLTRQQKTAARRIEAALASIEAALPGTVLRRETRCGRANCRCHGDPPQLHGPYWWWTRRVDGKTVTKILPDDLYEDYRQAFDNHRRARALLAELEAITLQAIEADPRYSQRRTRGPTAPAKPR